MKAIPLYGFLLLAGTTVLFAPPAWWSEAETRILEEQGEENNYAAANLGQLKHVAQKARMHLETHLADGAGERIDGMVASFEPGAWWSTHPAEAAAFRAANYAPINLGQLKAVARPFYDRLIAAGYDTRANLIAHGYPSAWEFPYPWNPETPPEENYEVDPENRTSG